MSDVKVLDQLPEINQDSFPALPEVSEGRYLIPFGSEWNKAEKEYIAGILITAATRAGQWIPVSAQEFRALLTGYSGIPKSAMVYIGLFDIMWEMNGTDLDIVQVGDLQYIVPRPILVEISLRATAPRLV